MICPATKRGKHCVGYLGHAGLHVYRPLWSRGRPTKEWSQARRWCFDRAKGLCEARVSPDSTGRAEHAHHILLRAQGGADDPSNLLAVCHFCHQHIHANPVDSARRGFLILRSAPAGA